MSASPQSLPIRFFFQDVLVNLADRNRLKKFLWKVLKENHIQLLSLNYIFTTDKAVLQINRDFLQHDYYTDIISFDLKNPDGLEAEIYISVDRVRENAQLLKIPIKQELHRVIFHGILHFCGYKDKSSREEAKMRQMEDLLLTRYFKRST